MGEIEIENIVVEGQTQLSSDDVPPSVVLFGKYKLRRFLGYGAFAKVYQAENVITGETVAIKAVSKNKVLKAGLTEQVEREISIMRRLHHPHTLKLFEVLATKTKIYFVMEFAQGGELFDKVAKGRFSEDLSRRYFQQLISALRYCHSQGVFHRDLKLDNLLIDQNLDLKISDFGLSAVKDQIRPDGLLHTICGTPAYVAPEILAKKGYDGVKVDVWSCGVILFALIAGYLPFNDNNITIMYRKIYRGQFRFPRWTSPDLKRLISRLLDANPNTRITVDEIMRDPWFSKGYKEVQIQDSHCDCMEKNNYKGKYLNAFDLISLSTGLDMSGLFTAPEALTCVERIVSTEEPTMIMEKIEKVATAARLTVRKEEGGCGAKLEGQNGNLIILVGIYRLTEELVVVEIEEKGLGDWRLSTILERYIETPPP